MKRNRRVAVDVHPHNALRYVDWDAIICVDIIRATSSLVASVMRGRETFSAASIDEALRLAEELRNPLLAGEIGGIQPPNFEIQNSPAEIAAREDIDRPLILVSTSGTRLIANAAACPAVYVASFQNLTATADYVAKKHDRVAVLGAGSRFEFRREDQMGTSWIAEKLLDSGFEAADERTRELVQRWSGAATSEAGSGNSAAYLRRSGQEPDLHYVLNHFDDYGSVCISVVNRVQAIGPDSSQASRKTVDAVRVNQRVVLTEAAGADH